MPTLKRFILVVSFGLWPVLSLWHANVDLVRWSTVLRPAMLVLALSLGLFWLAGTLMHDKNKAALVVALFWTLFFAEGFLRIGDLTLDLFAAPQAGLWRAFWLGVMVIFFIFGAIAIGTVKSQSAIQHALTITGTAGLALLLIPAVPISGFLAKASSSRAPSPSLSRPAQDAPPQPTRRPDIYYLIFDAHTRSDILQEFYGYDDSAFTGELRKLGFYVASQSTSNYPQTYLSIPSALNMRYLNDMISGFEDYQSGRDALADMIDQSEVARLARQLGYEFVVFDSGWSGDSYVPYADQHIKMPGALSEFENILLGKTILSLIDFKRLQYAWHRARIEYFFDQLPVIAAQSQPTLTYAHTIAPHPPFVFGPQGEPLTPNSSYTLFDTMWRSSNNGSADQYRQQYRDQVSYIDRRMLETIKKIFAASDEPPIIIVQGDHGPALEFTYQKPSQRGLRERYSILNAYFFPPASSTPPLYPTITPVNTFRLLFNQYFGTDYPLLEDRNHMLEYDYRTDLFSVSEVTKAVQTTTPSVSPSSL